MVGGTTNSPSVLVCGGSGRLPGQQSSDVLFIEVELDRASLTVSAVYVSPNFQGLKRLLESALVGKPLLEAETAGMEAIQEAYNSPFRGAARAALFQAAESFRMAEKKRQRAFLASR